MKWHVDEHGKLVITITRNEQRSLKVAQRRDQSFDSDAFMHELLEPLVQDGFAWLPEGCIDDLTGAPTLGILGAEMPGPDDPQDVIGMGLVHVGCWDHDGRLRQMYEPVLRRWAFMDHAVTSPQRVLADSGRCVWEGGDFWGKQEAAVKAVSEVIGY